MNREILFRGKRDGKWVYGSLHIEYGETVEDAQKIAALAVAESD